MPKLPRQCDLSRGRTHTFKSSISLAGESQRSHRDPESVKGTEEGWGALGGLGEELWCPRGRPLTLSKSRGPDATWALRGQARSSALLLGDLRMRRVSQTGPVCHLEVTPRRRAGLSSGVLDWSPVERSATYY